MSTSSNRIRIAIIGAGAVSDYHHVPGINIDPRAELVAACDMSEALLEQRKSDWGIEKVTTDFNQIFTQADNHISSSLVNSALRLKRALCLFLILLSVLLQTVVSSSRANPPVLGRGV